MPVIAYHTVDPRPSILAVSPALFEWQMRWLTEHSFRVIVLNEIVECLRQGKSLPPRSVAITFDDGFEGIYRYAFPVLKSIGFPATIFVVPNYCGWDNGWPGQPAEIPRLKLASWDAIWEMERAGMEIGSHTLTHPRLDTLPTEGAEKEILGSKLAIEERLGHPVRLFAYPYGRCNPGLLSLVKGAYSGAATTRLEMVRTGGDPYQIGRVDAFYLRSRALFGLLSRPGSLGLYLGIRKILHQSKSRLFKKAWV